MKLRIGGASRQVCCGGLQADASKQNTTNQLTHQVESETHVYQQVTHFIAIAYLLLIAKHMGQQHDLIENREPQQTYGLGDEIDWGACKQ